MHWKIIGVRFPLPCTAPPTPTGALQPPAPCLSRWSVGWLIWNLYTGSVTYIGVTSTVTRTSCIACKPRCHPLEIIILPVSGHGAQNYSSSCTVWLRSTHSLPHSYVHTIYENNVLSDLLQIRRRIVEDLLKICCRFIVNLLHFLNSHILPL